MSLPALNWLTPLTSMVTGRRFYWRQYNKTPKRRAYLAMKMRERRELRRLARSTEKGQTE